MRIAAYEMAEVLDAELKFELPNGLPQAFSSSFIRALFRLVRLTISNIHVSQHGSYFYSLRRCDYTQFPAFV